MNRKHFLNKYFMGLQVAQEIKALILLLGVLMILISQPGAELVEYGKSKLFLSL